MGDIGLLGGVVVMVSAGGAIIDPRLGTIMPNTQPAATANNFGSNPALATQGFPSLIEGNEVQLTVDLLGQMKVKDDEIRRHQERLFLLGQEHTLMSLMLMGRGGEVSKDIKVLDFYDSLGDRQ